MKNKTTNTIQESLRRVGAFLGLLLLFICAASISSRAADREDSSQSTDVFSNEFPSQSYNNSYTESSASGYSGGILRGFGDDDEGFETGGSDENEDKFNDSSIEGCVISLMLLLVFYIFYRGWKFRNQIQG